jgi:hypothetical protein
MANSMAGRDDPRPVGHPSAMTHRPWVIQPAMLFAMFDTTNHVIKIRKC